MISDIKKYLKFNVYTGNKLLKNNLMIPAQHHRPHLGTVECSVPLRIRRERWRDSLCHEDRLARRGVAVGRQRRGASGVEL
jgi:hypothetical protein